MKCFALTGGIASGKSLIADLLRKAQIPVVDADELARQVAAIGSKGLTQIVSRFGNAYLIGNGSLNRKKLAQLIFSDEKARKDLEAIIHPLIAEKFAQERARLKRQGHMYCVYVAPLIFEAGVQKEFDAVILIITDPKIQLDRLATRDRISLAEAKLRMQAQMPTKEKKKLTKYWIDNNGTPEDTTANLKALWKQLTGAELAIK